MSTTTKSPRMAMVLAHQVAQEAPPAYAHRLSPRTYTLPLDYRGVLSVKLRTLGKGLSVGRCSFPGAEAERRSRSTGVRRSGHRCVSRVHSIHLHFPQSPHVQVPARVQRATAARHAVVGHQRVSIRARVQRATPRL